MLTTNVKRNISCGCSKQTKGEYIIEKLLKDNNISYETEYRDNNCKLSTGGIARFDFKVNNQYYIEFDGKQHFEASGRFWDTE